MYKNLPSPRWNETRKRWELSIMRNGKRRAFTSQKKTTGKKEVIEKASKWLDAFGSDDKTDRLLSEVWELYINDYIARKGENEQIRHLRSTSRVYILPALGDRRCGTLRIEDWQNVINTARPHNRRCKELSRKYLNNIRGVIINFCRWAVARDYLTKDPSGQLYVPNNAKTVGKDILQVEDIAVLFSKRTGYWYERAFLLEVLTGMRPGEVLGLQWDDYEGGALHINRSVNSLGRVTPGKNKNAKRTIALPPEARDLLEEQRRETKHLKSQWIFCNKVGGKAAQNNYRVCWNLVCETHGFPAHVTPYSLRHTFFTHTEAYLPDRMVKAIFGHSSTTDSHKLYGSHTINGEAVEAAHRLAVTPLYEAAKKNAQQ